MSDYFLRWWADEKAADWEREADQGRRALIAADPSEQRRNHWSLYRRRGWRRTNIGPDCADPAVAPLSTLSGSASDQR
jgi:hypothetical protein